MRIEGNSGAGLEQAMNSQIDKVNQPAGQKSENQQDTNGQTAKPDINKLKKTLENINQFLTEHPLTHIHYTMHDKLGEYYVQVVDDKTKQVVREIPPKKFLDIYAAMLEKIGLLVDERI